MPNKKSIEEFIKLSYIKTQGKCDYSLVEPYIKNNKTKVTIKCNICNTIFKQSFNNHLRNSGHGCPECKKKVLSSLWLKTNKNFIDSCSKVHYNFYDYSLVKYKGKDVKVSIICPIHGKFEQRPSDHLKGHGCKKCGIQCSKLEQEFIEIFKNLNINYIQSYRPKWLDKKEIDLFLPDHSIGIEVNGIIFHSTYSDNNIFNNSYLKDKTYHQNKYLKCKENGIDLIHIFDFENIEKWKNLIINLFDVNYEITYKNIRRKIQYRNFEYTVFGKSYIKRKSDAKDINYSIL